MSRQISTEQLHFGSISTCSRFDPERIICIQGSWHHEDLHIFFFICLYLGHNITTINLVSKKNNYVLYMLTFLPGVQIVLPPLFHLLEQPLKRQLRNKRIIFSFNMISFAHTNTLISNHIDFSPLIICLVNFVQ